MNTYTQILYHIVFGTKYRTPCQGFGFRKLTKSPLIHLRTTIFQPFQNDLDSSNAISHFFVRTVVMTQHYVYYSFLTKSYSENFIYNICL
jgi:hypothetical protein